MSTSNKKRYRFEIIIIGTGQATGTILPELLKKKRSIAVIESAKVGGTCINWGCTPTKTLIASARAAHIARRGRDFGIETGKLDVDFSKVMTRVNEMRGATRDGLENWLTEVTSFYRGEASFLDAHTVRVGDETLIGEEIIIHTGTRARKPLIKGIDDVPWLDNRGILALDALPEHLLVVGGSYIGLEFAQAFRRLGSAVTVFARGPRIVPREDPDIADVARNLFEGEGIRFFLNTDIQELEMTGSDINLTFLQDGTSASITGSHLLTAIGRVPNSDGLNLGAAGVETDNLGFIKVNDLAQTSVPHIYALGDVNGRGAFTHTSVHDGQVFLDRLDGGSRKISDRIPIYSMFIDPPLARVGMSETEAERSGRKVLMATREMSKINRAREKDEKGGLIKLLVEEDTDLILGAIIFGVGGDEIMGMVALAMQGGLPYTKLQETVIPHPTVSELIPWVFADLRPLEN
jgi:pyruvate/2-oxoglutarate dehydrogenase complex dihydrolipoamide dehydrogenase (E3) component